MDGYSPNYGNRWPIPKSWKFMEEISTSAFFIGKSWGFNHLALRLSLQGAAMLGVAWICWHRSRRSRRRPLSFLMTGVGRFRWWFLWRSLGVSIWLVVFQTFFMFQNIWDMTNIFQRGWHHQPAINGGTPIAGWFLVGKILRWMIFWGTPIYGTPHISGFGHLQGLWIFVVRSSHDVCGWCLWVITHL